MTTVLELVADDAVMTHVDRMTAGQRLHRLLVDAHDDTVLGRVPVEAADPCDLGSKVGIRGMQPVADTVRAPATGSEYASDSTAAHPLAAGCVQGVRDRLVRPHVAKHHAVVRRSLARQLNDLASGLQRHTRWPPASRSVKERLDARVGIPASSPLTYDAIAAAGQRSGPRWTMSVREPDDGPRPDHDVMLRVPTSRERLHPRPLRTRDAQSSRSRAGPHVPSIHGDQPLFPWPGSRNELPASRTRSPV